MTTDGSCGKYNFGQHCQFLCHCNRTEERCSLNNGSCLSGCATNWTGPRCQTTHAASKNVNQVQPTGHLVFATVGISLVFSGFLIVYGCFRVKELQDDEYDTSDIPYQVTSMKSIEEAQFSNLPADTEGCVAAPVQLQESHFVKNNQLKTMLKTDMQSVLLTSTKPKPTLSGGSYKSIDKKTIDKIGLASRSKEEEPNDLSIDVNKNVNDHANPYENLKINRNQHLHNADQTLTKSDVNNGELYLGIPGSKVCETTIEGDKDLGISAANGFKRQASDKQHERPQTSRQDTPPGEKSRLLYCLKVKKSKKHGTPEASKIGLVHNKKHRNRSLNKSKNKSNKKSKKQIK